MDDGAAATNVDWREWGPEAFEAAEAAGKPILLALRTPWCAECAEMDRTTYTEPRLAAHLNDGFVPVRVDADRRPRIRERYTMGGFPSTVFLTPAGTVITGATFLGVDGFREILDAVRRTWDGKGEAAGSVPRALREAEPPGGAVTARFEEGMVEQLLAAYDDEYGGWGSDVKFPLPRTVEFALVRARDQGLRTLEAVRAHLMDTYDGGFYRFARQRNWGDARLEKLLDENAALCRAFARAYRYTGDEAHRDAAERTVEYLTTDLWTGDAFAGSQGGDPEYYRLDPSNREAAEAPAVDGTVFADRNGLAIDACLWFAAYTDSDRARSYARRAREYVTETLVDGDGRVTHFVTADGTMSGSPAGLLLDQAQLLQGLTTAWQVTGTAGPARRVADWTLEHRQTESGAFADGPAEGAGLLDRPTYPLDANAELADALLDLALLTGEDRYGAAAHDAVAAFGDAADRLGVEVAHVAAVAARLRSQSAIEVATPAGSDLHRAALRLADHETVVVPDAAREGGPAAEGDGPAPGMPADRARLVVAGTVQGTATDPAGLEELVTGDPGS